MLESAYKILRIGRDASPEALRKAYVTLVRRYPPEHFPDKFASINQAYQKLTLADEFIDEALQRTKDNRSPLELAGFLWGDRSELAPDEKLDLLSLTSLLAGEAMKRELDNILTIAGNSLEWKG
jgi:curved DNA-binding protein CbpA